jgi:hypothetical protein
MLTDCSTSTEVLNFFGVGPDLLRCNAAGFKLGFCSMERSPKRGQPVLEFSVVRLILCQRCKAATISRRALRSLRKPLKDIGARTTEGRCKLCLSSMLRRQLAELCLAQDFTSIGSPVNDREQRFQARKAEFTSAV